MSARRLTSSRSSVPVLNEISLMPMSVNEEIVSFTFAGESHTAPDDDRGELAAHAVVVVHVLPALVAVAEREVRQGDQPRRAPPARPAARLVHGNSRSPKPVQRLGHVANEGYSRVLSTKSVVWLTQPRSRLPRARTGQPGRMVHRPG